MPSKMGSEWPSEVQRRAECFVGLLSHPKLQTLVRKLSLSVSLRTAADYREAPARILRQAQKKCTPEQLVGQYRQEEPAKLKLFFEKYFDKRDLNQKVLRKASPEDLEKWLLRYLHEGAHSSMEVLSSDYREDLEEWEEHSQLAKNLKFTKVRWQDVQSFMESLEKSELKDFSEQHNLQITSHEQCKHLEVPTHLQGAGGPGKFLEDCYADQLQDFVHHLGISGAFEANFNDCEYTILLHWSKAVGQGSASTGHCSQAEVSPKAHRAAEKRERDAAYAKLLKEFGGWKGRDHEMKRAAEETLKNNMKLDKLKKLYEKASHNSGGAAHKGQDSMIAKILDAYMPSDLVAKLDKPCLEASLVWRVQQSDSDVNTERIKRIKGEKHHSTKKQLQWELLSAWHQNVLQVTPEDALDTNKRPSDNASSASESKQKKQKISKNGGGAGGDKGPGGDGSNGKAKGRSQHPLRIIQQAVNLAQQAYAAPQPVGCARTVRKELKGQEKLRVLLGQRFGLQNVLTEGQVIVGANLNGRYDLVVHKSVVIELKNLTSALNKGHVTQIKEYMMALKCKHGVLINFPKNERSNVDAERVILEDDGVTTIAVLHALE